MAYRPPIVYKTSDGWCNFYT